MVFYQVNKAKGRMSLSTKQLEDSKGDMLIDPQLVYETAEAMAAEFKVRLELKPKLRSKLMGE